MVGAVQGQSVVTSVTQDAEHVVAGAGGRVPISSLLSVCGRRVDLHVKEIIDVTELGMGQAEHGESRVYTSEANQERLGTCKFDGHAMQEFVVVEVRHVGPKGRQKGHA